MAAMYRKLKDTHPKYISPESVPSAVGICSAEPNAAYLAGGTDLMPLIRNNLREPGLLVDLEKLAHLKGIEPLGKEIFIGAMTDLASIAEHGMIRTSLPAVSRAAASVASPQIRNMATLGGNLMQEKRCLYFNQSQFWRQNVQPCYRLGGDCCYQIPGSRDCRALYYSDLAPVLMAYEARALVFDGKVREEIPAEVLIMNHCDGKWDKILVEGIKIPHTTDGSSGLFLKYSVRHAIDFALSSVAIRFTPKTATGESADIRIFVGAVAPAPVRLEETEKEVIKALKKPVSTGEGLFTLAETELRSRASLIREFTVSLKGKQNALLIISDALRSLFKTIGRQDLAV